MGEVVVVVGVGAEVVEADNTSYPFCDLFGVLFESRVQGAMFRQL